MAAIGESQRQMAWTSEVKGGVLSVVASLPQTIPVGIVVYQPFGAAGIGFGLTAALISAMIGGLIVALFGPMKVQIAGPRMGSALVLAELVRWLADLPDFQSSSGAALAAALPLVLLVVFLAGALQLLASALHLARYIKLMPLSVLSGFMLALGASMMLSTWHAFFGYGIEETVPLALPDAPHLRLAAVTLATVIAYGVAVLVSRKLGDLPMPPLVIAFLSGVAVHLAIGGSASSGPMHVIAAHPLLSGSIDYSAALKVLAVPAQAARIAEWALLLAVVSSIDSLLSLVTCDRQMNSDTDASEALKIEGIANMLVALAGGLTVSSSVGRTSVNISAGARQRLSSALAALLTGACLLLPDPGLIFPPPVMQGIVFIIGVLLYDGRLGQLIARLAARNPHHPDTPGELAVLVGTFAGTMVLGLFSGLSLGLALSVVLFLRNMSRSVIRRRLTGRQRRSRRARPPEQAEYLHLHGAETVIAELEGPLFFGTAEQVRAWILGETEARTVIIDLSRTFELDASGAAVLQQAIRRYLEAPGRAVALAGLAEGDDRREVLRLQGCDRLAPIMESLDEALEWAENRRLAGAPEGVHGVSRKSLPLLEGLDSRQAEILEQALDIRKYRAGEVIFGQGSEGDALFYLEEGAIRIELSVGGASNRGGGETRRLRLATLSPGVFFGEMSLIDGAPRSASAIAELDSMVLRLSRPNFERLAQEEPDLGGHLMRVLAADLARRLRLANAELSEAT